MRRVHPINRQQDLIALFEEFGPIKRASIAEQDGTSKGFGFVKLCVIFDTCYRRSIFIVFFAFSALEEDAHAAVEKLQGHLFKGRKMILEIAVVKGQTTKPEGPKKSDEVKPAKKSKQPAVAAPTEAKEKLPRPSMRVLVSGLPVTLKKKDLKAALRPLSSRKVDIEVVEQVRNTRLILYSGTHW